MINIADVAHNLSMFLPKDTEPMMCESASPLWRVIYWIDIYWID